MSDHRSEDQSDESAIGERDDGGGPDAVTDATDAVAGAAAPGTLNRMPGETDTDSSVGGAAPDGGALDNLLDAPEPGSGGVSGGSAGDSVADDSDEALDGTRPAPEGR